MLTIWRRHTATCPHREKGRDHLKCDCPLWADGYIDGKRMLRQSLKTRDMARARKRAIALEDPDAPKHKPIAEATEAFEAHCNSQNLAFSTVRKYRNTLARLQDFCQQERIDTVTELDVDKLDRFRAGRGLSPLSAAKELETLRQFWGYCVDRKWADSNVARRIKNPRNIKPADVEPYTQTEMTLILSACDLFGQAEYERSRARALVLAMRYTGLRIGDAAMLSREQFSMDAVGQRWRMFLRTEKSGKPVYVPVPGVLKDTLDTLPLSVGAMPECRHYFWNGRGSSRSLKAHIHRTLARVFAVSGVERAHAHRFRHTLATDLLARGATFEDVADILGNSPAVVRKHYAKWSQARQNRIDNLMQDYHEAVGLGTNWARSGRMEVSN